MKGLSLRRILPLLAVAVGVAGSYELAASVQTVTLGPGVQARSAHSETVTAVTRVCPSPGTLASSGVALIATPAAKGSGTARMSRLRGQGGPSLLTVTQPGKLSVAAVKPAAAASAAPAQPKPSGRSISTASGQGGVVIRAAGSMARGLEVEQTGPGAVSSARCGSPGTDFWFVGPGRSKASHIDLFLMNPGSQSADVTVEISTDAGPIQGSTDAGIAVAPHAMVVQSLDGALRGSRVIALHVRTSVGQVVAAVQETRGTARTGAWLPVAQAPSNKVVLPGLPAVAGTRQIFLTVPGPQDARVHVTAITTRGSYQPTGGAGLDIPGGSAVAIALPSMSGIPGAIKISSNVPVTASGMLTGGPRGAPGVFTAASSPIEEQGVVADNRTNAGATSELVLSAPGSAVKARITRIGENGSSAPGGGTGGAGSVVKIGAHHSLVVQLRRVSGGGSAFSVAIAPLPGSGPLYAGRVVETSGTGGTVQSILPVASALTKVPLPPVRDVFITAVP